MPPAELGEEVRKMAVSHKELMLEGKDSINKDIVRGVQDTQLFLEETAHNLVLQPRVE